MALAATVTSPLIPWNSRDAYMAATFGVPVTGYVAYHFFNTLNPIVTMFCALLGLRVIREPSEPAAKKPVSDKN